VADFTKIYSDVDRHSTLPVGVWSDLGCRTVVARYFEWALHLAGLTFEMPRLVIFLKEADATNIPGVGDV
jgi:hypothetical protein